MKRMQEANCARHHLSMPSAWGPMIAFSIYEHDVIQEQKQSEAASVFRFAYSSYQYNFALLTPPQKNKHMEHALILKGKI